jgi:AcrR family transcriptional regulator
LAHAKQPTQKRAQERFRRVLDGAEELLGEEGLSGFSIPALAERLGYVRGSIYAYFPTPHALLNELAKRHLRRIMKLFAKSPELALLPWRKGIETGVGLAADYYNAQPAARLLILGGAVTDYSYRAQEMTIKGIGDFGRAAWATRGIHLPTQPDVTTLAIDLGMSCFRRSVFEHGEITLIYRETAGRVMNGFLERYLEPAL